MAETGSPVIFASCRAASPFPASGCSPIPRAMEQSKATGADIGPGAIPVLADRLPPAVHLVLADRLLPAVHLVVASVAGQGASLLDLMVTSIPIKPASGGRR
jgi:hypothetical protein